MPAVPWRSGGEAAPAALRWLVGTRAASALGFYAFIPFTPIWAARAVDASPATGGLMLALFILAMRTGGMVMPPVIDRLGPVRFVQVSSAVATALCLVVAVWTTSVAALGVLLFCLGLLLSGNTAATKATVATLGGTYGQVRAFGALNMAANVGAGLGPITGAMLIGGPRQLLPGVMLVMFAIATLLALGIKGVGRTTRREAPSDMAIGRRLLWAPRRLLRFIAVTSLIWVSYAQVFDAMPTVLRPWVDERVVAAAFALNAALIVGLQSTASRLLERRGQATGDGFDAPLAASNLLLAVALVTIGLTPWLSGAAVIVGVLLFTLGELVWSPLLDAETARRRGSLSASAAFGLAGLVWGVVESAAAWLGVATSALLPGASSTAVFAVAAFAAAVGAVLIAGPARSRSRQA